MNYQGFIKKFDFPSDFKAPKQLTHDELVATPLTRNDLDDDLEAVNSSLDLILKTRGGNWPTEAVSEEDDLLDLAWHEREFRDGDSFAYVVYDKNHRYIGCFYLYPMGHRTPLTEDLLQYDVDASWWVASAVYDDGYYQKLYGALKEWLKEFPFEKVYYSNEELAEN